LVAIKVSKRMTKPFVSRNSGRLLLVVLFVCLHVDAHSLEVPRPEGYVNDRAKLLTAEEKARLESLLGRFESETTNQVVVLIVPSLEGDSLEDFSIRVAESWKPGQKDRDNGVIFLVALEDRKARIEVGYGLEGALTDAQTGRILQNLVFPAFREGDYPGGIQAGLVGILQSIRGEFPSQAAQGAEPTRQVRAQASGLLLLLLLILLLFSRAGRFFLMGSLWGACGGAAGEVSVAVPAAALAGSAAGGEGSAGAGPQEAGETPGRGR
jgi:uncharacterized protein